MRYFWNTHQTNEVSSIFDTFETVLVLYVGFFVSKLQDLAHGVLAGDVQYVRNLLTSNRKLNINIKNLVSYNNNIKNLVSTISTLKT